jgi:hypothetical protein
MGLGVASDMDNFDWNRLMVKQKYDPQDFDARDLFAALAMVGLLQTGTGIQPKLAQWSYDVADLMLKERENDR